MPKILENIFSYIPYEEHLFQLFMINYTWCLEGVRSFLKWYKNIYYRYNNNFNFILLINQFEGLECCNTYKHVHKKIYWPTEDKYNYIYDLNKKDRLEIFSLKSKTLLDILR